MPALAMPQARRSARYAWALGTDCLAWWLGELAGLVPPALRRILAGRAITLTIRINGDGLIFSRERGEAETTVSISDAALPATLIPLLDRADAVVLLLPSSKVLRRTISLPIGAASELSSAVPFLIERQTPFLLDHARYAFRVRSRGAHDKAIQVELAVTARAAYDTLQAWMEGRGIALSAVRIEDDTGVPRLDFMRQHVQGRRKTWRRSLWQPILVTAAVLLAAGPCWIALRTQHRAASLAATAVARGMEARHAETIRADLQVATGAMATLLSRTRNPRAIEVLDALSTGLPDDSWLFSLDLAGAEVRLGGFSADVPALIGRLQTIKIVDSLELESPVYNDATGNRARFDIKIHLRPDMS